MTASAFAASPVFADVAGSAAVADSAYFSCPLAQGETTMFRHGMMLLAMACTFAETPSDSRADNLDKDGNLLPHPAIARLGTTAWRCDFSLGAVAASLAFSPDGKLLAVGNHASVVVWDATTGKQVPGLGPFPGAQGAVFSRDGKRLITRAPFVEHWDSETGKSLRRLKIPAEAVWHRCPVLTADGRFLALPEPDHVSIWDGMTGKRIAQIEETPAFGVCVALTDDGTRVAVARQAKTDIPAELAIYDLPSCKLRYLLSRDGQHHDNPAFSPDGRWLVTAVLGTLCIWDTISGQLHREICGISGPVAFTTDGRHMACAAPRTIHLYNLPDFSEVRRFDDGQASSCAVAISADGTKLARAGQQAVSAWDLTTGKRLSPLAGNAAPIRQLAFSRDNKMLASASNGDGAVCVWDLETHSVKHHFAGHVEAAASIAFSADGKMLATGERVAEGSRDIEGHIRVWNLADGKLVRKCAGHVDGICSLDFAPDGKTLVSGGDDGRVRLWDVARGARLAQVSGKRIQHSARFSPDGKTLLIAARDDLSIWRSDMKARLRDLRAGQEQRGEVDYASFVRQGTRVFAQQTGARDCRWWVYDLVRATADNRTVPPWANAYLPWAHAISPDGALVADSPPNMGGQLIEIWDTDAAVAIVQLPPNPRYSIALAFSPDGKTLACGVKDGTILLWDMSRLRQAYALHRFLGKDGPAAGEAVKLASEPNKAVSFVISYLTRFAAAEKQVETLLAALDSDSYEERDSATRALAKIAADVEPLIRAIMARSKRFTLEARRRVERVLDGIDHSGFGAAPFTSQRAQIGLAILEQYDTAEARAGIAAVAKFAPQSATGRSAQALIDRLQMRRGETP